MTKHKTISLDLENKLQVEKSSFAIQAGNNYNKYLYAKSKRNPH